MRLLRGLAALLALLVGLAGIPTALVILAGNPLPSRLSWSAVSRALLQPDDGSTVIRLIALIGWLAWLVFALSLLTELVNVVSGYRIRLQLPGLGGPQRMVAGLLLAVITLVSLPTSAVMASPVAAGPSPVGHPTTRDGGSAQPSAAVSSPHLDPRHGGLDLSTRRPSAASAGVSDLDAARRVATGAETTSGQPAATGEHGDKKVTHVVQRGDDLWSLAADYYGQGREWRKISRANPHVLSGGPDRLQVGWRLVIPDVTPKGRHSSSNTVVVRSGDTLSSIAERETGHASKWTELFEANRTQLDDPDEIEAGAHLVVPASFEQPRTGETNSDAKSPQARADTDHADEHQIARRDPDGGEDRRSRPSRAPHGTGTSPQPTVTATAPPVTGAPPAASAPPTAKAPPASATDPPQTGERGPAVDQRPGRPTSAAQTASATSQPAAAGPSPQAGEEMDHDALEWSAGLLSVGGLLAAAVVGGLAWRRRIQLQVRPVGRRIAQPPDTARTLETALGHRQSPLDLKALDLAVRSIAVHCLDTGAELPTLTVATVGPDRIALTMSDHVPDAPVGFQVTGRSWTVGSDDAAYLSSIPGVDVALRPYPALVSLGVDDAGQQVLVNLEAIGLLALEGAGAGDAAAMLAAMAVELSFSPWADEMVLTLVGSSLGLPEALGKHNVAQTDGVDELLDRLERRAEAQRAHHDSGKPGQIRVDPDLADPWAPEIVLVNRELTDAQTSRLMSVVTAEPRVTIAAVVVSRTSTASTAGAEGSGGDACGGDAVRRRGWSLVPEGAAEAAASSSAKTVLHPLGLRVQPQRLDAATARTVVELVAATGSDQTSAAPWWDHGGDPPKQAPPDNVTYLGRRVGGWGSEQTEQLGGADVVAQGQLESDSRVAHHPTLRLLGPVELVGASGPVPPRASKQCLEYCGWLLEHPGTTAQAMASALVVAEGTRRSNMSRLRTWLGSNAADEPFLPDAYSGRIVLHPAVSSDWQRLQILTAAGVNRTSSQGLRAALELVRGAPLADAAPGQWHWAEELRTDMVSAVRDIGVEVTSRALFDQDVDLARWAAARALAAAPGDELLLALRIRTEHQAGNVAETERLTLQLAAQARLLGVDLDVETVSLLQEVMEGRVRARMA